MTELRVDSDVPLIVLVDVSSEEPWRSLAPIAPPGPQGSPGPH